MQVPNDHYINIVERSGGEKPTSIPKQCNLTDDSTIADYIIHHYEDHPSVRNIKNNVKSPQNSTISLLPISKLQTSSILKTLSTKDAP